MFTALRPFLDEAVLSSSGMAPDEPDESALRTIIEWLAHEFVLNSMKLSFIQQDDQMFRIAR